MANELVHDTAWRDSVYHITLADCSVYLDFSVAGDGFELKTASFDGEGCCRLEQGIPLPPAFMQEVAALVPNNGDHVELPEALFNALVEAVKAHKALVPEDWEEVWQGYDLL